MPSQAASVGSATVTPSRVPPLGEPGQGGQSPRSDKATVAPKYFNEDFERLAVRAAAANIVYREVEWGEKPKFWYTSAELDFPRGRGVRTIRLLSHDVPRALGFEFEEYSFSTRYDAIFNQTTGLIEAALTWSPATSPRSSSDQRAAWNLPGVELEEHSPLKTGEPLDRRETPGGWRLKVESADVAIELSPRSDIFSVLVGRYASAGVTLKIQHMSGANGPRVDELLGGIGQDFMMMLELRFGTGATLAEVPERAEPMPELSRESAGALGFPDLEFSKEPLAFYWYGVSATEFPLLQFLAFYQVLEYYFSLFTRRDTINRMRSLLKDPGFDRADDQSVGLLIEATRTAHAGLKQEADQLQRTILECTEIGALERFLRAPDERYEHFVGAKQRVRGVHPLRLDAEEDLRDQVATRIYKIRNRIVHTKSAAEESGLELLLPVSDESRFLGPEVELVRWLAQRALVHGARLR